MDKKTFNKITKELFLKYGFKKNKNVFILQLEDMSITVRLISWRKVLHFVYNFGINDLYDDTTPLEKRYESLIEIKMKHDESADGYHKQEILYEQYTEEGYRNLLDQLLHKYFDGYKEEGLNYITKNNHNMILTKKAKEYLGIKD